MDNKTSFPMANLDQLDADLRQLGWTDKSIGIVVGAVRSHAVLVDALKGMIRSVSMNCQEHGPLPGAVKANIQKANAAIAQAEGRE